MEYYLNMTTRQWLALLCLYTMYVFLGTAIFYTIEHNLETERRAVQLQERIDINELLIEYTSPDNIEKQNEILDKVSDYCGRKVTNHTLDEYIPPYVWNVFHSFYFSFTTCTTVGYGNISPNSTLGRIILCFYALFGLPISFYVIAVVGNYYETTYYRLYEQYKQYKYATTKNYVPAEFGLVGKILMYLTPGLIIFIFMPAILFSYFEDWDYVTSVYYSFVTLSTVGYGDRVPTFQPHQERTFGIYFLFYEIFIIVWNIGGLGYILMIISFVAKGMQSKAVCRLEHMLSQNIKSTQRIVWNEVTKDVSYLRRLLNEVNMMKFKPVYTDEKKSHMLARSSSCPELTMFHRDCSIRKLRSRSYSESAGQASFTVSTSTLNRVQSENDLHRIDRKKTFESSQNQLANGDLITRVVSALGSFRPYDEDGRSCLELGIDGGINGFSDSQILASERSCSGWSLPRSDGDFSLIRVHASDSPASRVDSLKSSNELTWNGSNSPDLKKYLASQALDNIKGSTNNSPRAVSYNRSVSLNMPDDPDNNNEQNIGKKQVINRILNKTNIPKSRLLQGKRNSLTNQDIGLQTYLDRTSAGRESVISLPRQYISSTSKGRGSVLSILDTPANAANSELLEKTSIADLIRALEMVHAQSNLNPSEKENDSSNTQPKFKNIPMQKASSRRGSLRPVQGYTTIFTSSNAVNPRKISSLSNPEPSHLSRHLSLRPRHPPPPYTATATSPMAGRFTLRPSNTSPERANSPMPSSLLLQKKVPLGPSPLARDDTRRDSLTGCGSNVQPQSTASRLLGSSSASKNLLRRPIMQSPRTRHISLDENNENNDRNRTDSKL